MDDAFGNWLAGFIDGEGSFAIREYKGRWYCSFGLEVRDDDADAIKTIYRRTGIGTLGLRGPRSRSSNRNGGQISWKVQAVSDCVALDEILMRYPLRAKKARDFLVWHEALDDQAAHVLVRGRKAGSSAGEYLREQDSPEYLAYAERMRQRREILKAIRTYGGQLREAGDAKAVEGALVPVAP